MVAILVTAGSDRVKSGRYFTTGSDHDTTLSVTAAEMQVLETDLETDAAWKTVSGVTRSGFPASRTPNPLAYMTLPPWTTAMAMPGIPLRFMVALAMSSSLST